MKLSPSLNTLGGDRQLTLALQINGRSPQMQHYMPKSNPESLLGGWNGNDGWVANSIVDVSFTFSVGTGAHTLKVRPIEFPVDKEHVLTPPDVCPDLDVNRQSLCKRLLLVNVESSSCFHCCVTD